MVKAAITHARNFMQGKDTPYETATMSHALLLSVGALYLTNMLMRSFGFKDERWGWKYVKNVETEEGPKQLVITWSNPINLIPKYVYRWQDAANPAETNSMLRWLDSTSWELHPIWRTVSSLVQNRNERGEAIVNPFDSYAKIQGDRSWYFFSRTIPMFKWFQDTFWPNTTLDSKEAVRVLDKNVNTAFAYLMRAAAFPYLRSSADQRAASQMNKLIIEYRIQMRRNLRNTDPAHWDKAFKREQERMKRLQERINQVWEAAQESNQKLD
jgi:hypothetical protein